MLKAIFTFIISLADTLTMTMLSINHLARAAVERTVVVEKKSVAAAALSEMESINTLALRLQDIQSDANGISPESFDKAKTFLAAYQAKRKQEMASLPSDVQRSQAKSPTKGKAAPA